MLLLLSEIFSCDESNISLFIDFSKLKSPKFESEDGAGFLPLNPSSSVRPSTAFRRVREAVWRGDSSSVRFMSEPPRAARVAHEPMYNEIINCRCNAKPFINLIPEAMIKYFIYCRKSSEDEERQVLSIEPQLHELREYANQNGLFIVREYYESKTAKEPGREIFNEMLGEIEKGSASGI